VSQSTNRRGTELGDASVPFRYDVHALVFNEDAVGLETLLQHALADRRVNMVNNRREFFSSSPGDVRELLHRPRMSARFTRTSRSRVYGLLCLNLT